MQDQIYQQSLKRLIAEKEGDLEKENQNQDEVSKDEEVNDSEES